MEPTRKVYFAARFRHRSDLIVKASQLESYGHEVTSRWITGFQQGYPDDACAINDEEDLRRADTIIFFSEKTDSGDRGGGGRHVELGIAYALGKSILIVGSRENLFHSLPGILVFEDWEELKRTLCPSN